MPIPSPIIIRNDHVEYVNNVDRVKYTLDELTRAALKDVGKFIRKRVILRTKERYGGSLRRSKRPYVAFQYWVRRKEGNLQVGIGNTKKERTGNTWYGIQQELGTHGQPQYGILRNTVFENIDEIRKIEGAYIQAIEDENRALGLINEEEEVGDSEDES